MVSPKTCSGCIYYGPIALSNHKSLRCCNYFYLTGQLRPRDETCADCSVKTLGKRLRRKVQINVDHSQKGIQQYRDRMGRDPKRERTVSSVLDPEDVAFLQDLFPPGDA